MKKIMFTLDNDDLNIIFESLCDNPDADIADSALTDMFMVLSKSAEFVTINTVEEVEDVVPKDDADEFVQSVINVLDELGDLDDLTEKTKNLDDNDFSDTILGMINIISDVLDEGNQPCTCVQDLDETDTDEIEYDDDWENWVVDNKQDESFESDGDCDDCGEDIDDCACNKYQYEEQHLDAWDSGTECWNTED